MASSGWYKTKDFRKEERESVASLVKVGRLLLLFKDRMELILSII